MIICIWQQLEVQKSLEEMILVILHQDGCCFTVMVGTTTYAGGCYDPVACIVESGDPRLVKDVVVNGGISCIIRKTYESK